VELLAARTSMKKEVRAEVTVMASVANNPLKFSPTTELALQYLLGPETPGFMSPAQSMQDAYDDLKAHQLGVMAGMRAALRGVLKRFDPSALEGKVASHSGFASLIPSTRKAQLWEQFQELYDQLYSEAEDNFEELFGNAFAKEYERYVAQLNSSSTKR
jgi:type VI secretion system FHA domain protein